MTTADVLRGARGLLVADGWGQGAYRSPDGRLCLVGALRRAAGCVVLDDPNSATTAPAYVLSAAEDVLAAPLRAARVGRGWDWDGEWLAVEEIGPWNDLPGRTVVEVLAHLDAVIADVAGTSAAGAVA